MSIVNKNNLLDPFLVEFKFQYTNDFKQFRNYKIFIERDFQRFICNKQSDIFILIICSWKKLGKFTYDNEWGITSNLSRFLSANEQWRNNIKNLFCEYQETVIDELNIEVAEPYMTNYNFFIISREKVSR